MAAQVDAARWTCGRKGDFSLHEWPDGSVVFDEANGQLHCLTPVAGEALAQILASDGRTSGEIAESLLGETPTPIDSEMMENMLLSLASMNLIDRHLAPLSVK
jgi:hypothetical protein